MQQVVGSNREIEQAVIGVMLMNNGKIHEVVKTLQEDDFGQDDLRKIYAVIKNLYNSGQTSMDDVLIRDKLMADGSYVDANIHTTIIGCMNVSKSPDLLEAYMESVKNSGLRRKYAILMEELRQHAYNGEIETMQLLPIAGQRVAELLKSSDTIKDKTIEDIIKASMCGIGKMLNGEVGEGITTGFSSLDRKLFKIENSDLVLIAARPSMGKTAFALNIVENVALQQSKAVGFFSLEMNDEQLGQRMICSQSGVSLQKIRDRNITSEELSRMDEAANRISRAPFYFSDKGCTTITSLIATAKKWKAEHDIGLIVIDYLQLISGSAKTSRSGREQEVSEISRSLKLLAKDLDIPIIALSQLNRSVEYRQDKRPMLADLRESGSLEQDADIIMFLYREDYYKEDSERPNVCDVILSKHRNGALGTVELYFGKDTFHFSVLGKDEEPERVSDDGYYPEDAVQTPIQQPVSIGNANQNSDVQSNCQPTPNQQSVNYQPTNIQKANQANGTQTVTNQSTNTPSGPPMMSDPVDDPFEFDYAV